MTNKNIVEQLRGLLSPKVDYAELVGAESFAYGQHYVWADPESYIINDAVNEIEHLQSENTRLKAERDKAVEDMQEVADGNTCYYCVKYETDLCYNGQIYYCSNFQWEGLEVQNEPE